MADAHAEAMALLLTLSAQLDALLVRGLRAASAEDRARLASHREQLQQMGAAQLAAALGELLDAMADGRREAAHALLAVRARLRVFERLLTQRAVLADWAAADAAGAPP
ncbi:MAG: hypothetical protein MUE46_16410 [Xanthomonadales bacterium]|nr:hypothetical protein [Xanthomonadales bacterium]